MEGPSLSTIAIKLTVVALLVLANAFFVASEFALVSVRRSRIAALIADGNKRARTVMRIVDNLSSYIPAFQLGVTLASLALGSCQRDDARQSIRAQKYPAGLSGRVVTFVFVTPVRPRLVVPAGLLLPLRFPVG
jgi:CBS domain containing-hemolysin-like protein